MRFRRSNLVPILFIVLISFVAVPKGIAQMPGMTAMENSVGYLSSGTSIEPLVTSEASPMIQGSLGGWKVMFHGTAFLQSIQQSGPRGGDKVFSTNWIMPMLTRKSGRHSLALRAMLSFEPATVTKRRFPQLFQTGETAFGLPIVDGQHPHNFFMEVTGRYDIDLNDKTRLFFFGGPVGEPALGPPAFPHRASASENPLAMQGHHSQDSTHVSYSVITTGLSAGPVQLEASIFHGQEPNENRWYFGTGKPDSFASRLTIAPSKNLSGQYSIGRINNREALEPGLDTLRMTASIHHGVTLNSGSLASSIIWGRNKDMIGSEHRIFNSYALESTLNFFNRNWTWTRIENLDKDKTLLTGETPASLDVEETPIGRVRAYSFGYERDIVRTKLWANIGLGFQFTTYGLTDQMKTVYGNNPRSYVVFLHVRPVGNMAAHMRAMHNQ
jgi:hypothetical protein